MDEKSNLPAEEKTFPRQETFPELWNLKEMREARGLSLKDLFEKTRISQINLIAVENNDFKRLPPPVYARNFIQKYARAVDIDEKPILDRYERYIASLEPPQEEIEVRKPWPETGLRHRFLIGSLIAVITAGILVFAIFLHDQGGKPPSPAPVAESVSPAQAVAPDPAETTPAQPTVVPNSPTQVTVVPSAPTQTAVVPNAPVPTTKIITVPAQTAAVPSVTVQSAASKPAQNPAQKPVAAEKPVPPPAAAGKTYHLVIEARELTWIRIAEDRNPSSQILLKPGDKVERAASDYFQLDIGNAGGINLSFQGKSLGSIGTQGQVVHMRLPEKGSEKKSP